MQIRGNYYVVLTFPNLLGFFLTAAVVPYKVFGLFALICKQFYFI